MVRLGTLLVVIDGAGVATLLVVKDGARLLTLPCVNDSVKLGTLLVVKDGAGVGWNTTCPSRFHSHIYIFNNFSLTISSSNSPTALLRPLSAIL